MDPRLALIIAEFQCDVLYRGQMEALAEFLPLDAMNWVTCGNALRLDWLSICPPTGSSVKFAADDLFHTPRDQAQIDFENEGGETYICGNPPYLGSTWQSDEQKSDLMMIFEGRTSSWKSLDYVAGWFMKAADYGTKTNAVAAFVSTNSICQGQQVPIIWPLISATGHQIAFAHTSFKWANLASYNAGVTVVIVGISSQLGKERHLFSISDSGSPSMREVENINAYLVAGPDIIVNKSTKPLCAVHTMDFGSKPVDGGNLLLDGSEYRLLSMEKSDRERFIKRVFGSEEFINGIVRYCIWIDDSNRSAASNIPELKNRFAKVAEMRMSSSKARTRQGAAWPHKFDEVRQSGNEMIIVVPAISSENRDYLPCGVLPAGNIITNKNYALYDAPLWNMALIASRLHWVWIGTVCIRLEMRFSYSNTLGWNTFPVPKLTDQNKADLTRCAENILLVREAHFPATIADLYDSENMPEDLRHAHEENDELLERIYIGRRFRNDTERLEKLFDLYTKMTAAQSSTKKKGKTIA